MPKDQRQSLLNSTVYKVTAAPVLQKVDTGTVSEVLAVWRGRWNIDLDTDSDACSIAVQLPTTLSMLVTTGLMECMAIPQVSRGRVAVLFSGCKG